MTRPRPIDLLIVAGFLGAGKTSLLAHLLATAGDRRLAVVVNEWSRHDVDGDRLQAPGRAIDRISGGSIFCHCRAATLQRTLDDLLDRRSPPDAILVEASGLADPSTLPGLLAELGRCDRLRPRVITLVHPLTLGKVLPSLPATAGQLRAADLIVCNHCDHCSDRAVTMCLDLIREFAPTTPLYRSDHGRVDWSVLTATSRASHVCTEESVTAKPAVLDAELQPPAESDLTEWLAQISRHFGQTLLRAKGQLYGPAGPEQIDWDGHRWQRRPLPEPAATANRLIVLLATTSRDRLFRFQQEQAAGNA